MVRVRVIDCFFDIKTSSSEHIATTYRAKVDLPDVVATWSQSPKFAGDLFHVLEATEEGYPFSLSCWLFGSKARDNLEATDVTWLG